MHPDGNQTGQDPPAADDSREPFAANEMWLSPRQWLATWAVICAAFYLIPVLWERIEPLETGPDYRIPYRLGADYWTYSRYCRQVCSQDQTLTLGDSVIWGHYVSSQQTLSHYLNELARRQEYANLGVDGIHPVALAGLVDYYGREIRHQRVILNCNLLWMSSPRADLQEEREATLNHPELVPQLFPRIPCYHEPISSRLGIAVGRHLALFGWAKHLQMAYFDGSDLRHWTVDHPYADPARAVTLQLPSPDEPPSPKPVAEPWTRQGIVPRSFPWVELETSLQWRFFRRTVETLRARGNRVFVLVGPFNEHMLTPESLEIYGQRQREVETWLEQNRIAHYAPPALPSREYADASHPLAEGYRRLAEQLFVDPAFVEFRSQGAEGH